MIVDAWMQHPTGAFARDPMFATLLRWIGQDALPDTFPVELSQLAMQAAGVDIALVSAWCGPRGFLLSNEHVAEVVDSAPSMFRGVASVDLRDPMGAVRQLRHLVTDRGFVAVRQLPWLWELPPDDRRYYPIYAACIDLGVPFCTQIGHAGPLMPSEPGRPIPYLDRVLCDFPELVVVGGHVGYPWTEEAIALASKYPNFFIDTSAWKLSRLPPALVTYMMGRGRSKVLFGSNFPMITPLDCLAGLPGLGLDDEARALFLGGNARRVFRLEAAA